MIDCALQLSPPIPAVRPTAGRCIRDPGRDHSGDRREPQALGQRKDAEDLGRATEPYEQALDRDPENALAYAGLDSCRALRTLVESVAPAEAFMRVKEPEQSTDLSPSEEACLWRQTVPRVRVPERAPVG